MATISPPALSPLAGEEEEAVLGKVTEVIKALSNRVVLSPPHQYIDLVKVSHMTRAVDNLSSTLPDMYRVLVWQ